MTPKPIDSLQRQLIDYISTEILDEMEMGDIDVDDDLLRTNLLDSLGVMRLVTFIHDELNVDVPAEDVTLGNFRTVAVLASYLSARRETVNETGTEAAQGTA